MNVHMSYKIRKSPDLEREINHLIEKLGKRLQFFRPELVHLRGVIEENSAHKRLAVALNLRLPSGQMAVQESGDTVVGAMKAASEDLLHQVARHKEQLRNSHKWRGRRRPGVNRHESQVPFETTVASVQAPIISSEDIRSYVNVNLSRLERFVERELYAREAAEQIARNAVSQQEVIDETIARALGDGDERPERLALEPWLYRTALNVIRDLGWDGEDGAAVHLEQSVRRPNERASDEAELQFHQPDESFTEETVIADYRLSTPEAVADSDEMIALVQYALNGAARADREVFILNAIEGFTVDEIAAITDRKGEQVRSSILSVREHLRRFPPIAGRFRGKMLQNSAAD